MLQGLDAFGHCNVLEIVVGHGALVLLQSNSDRAPPPESAYHDASQDGPFSPW